MDYESSAKEIAAKVIEFLRQSADYKQIKPMQLFIPKVDLSDIVVCKSNPPWRCVLPNMTNNRADEICRGVKCENCICQGEHKKELAAHIEKLKKDKKPLFIPDIDYLNAAFNDTNTHCALSYLGDYPVHKICKGIECENCICHRTHAKERLAHIEKLKEGKKQLFIPDVNFLALSLCQDDIHCALPINVFFEEGMLCEGVACVDCICWGLHRKELQAHIKKIEKGPFMKGQQVLVSNTNGRVYKRIFSHVVKDSYFTFLGGQTEWTSNGKLEEWVHCKAPH